MYRIESLKRNNKDFKMDYKDFKIAQFEFDCMKYPNVSQWAVIYKIEDDSMQQLDLYIG